MRSQNTIEGMIAAAEQSIAAIKSAQRILGSKADLIETLYEGSNTTFVIPAFLTRTIAITFTPTDFTNPYAEVGISWDISPDSLYYQTELVAEPDPTPTTSYQRWLFLINNGESFDISLTITSSVVCALGGVITQELV